MWPNGREDEFGNVWFATDPFPHWFREVDGQIIEPYLNGYHIRWKDELAAEGGLKLVTDHAFYQVHENKCRGGGVLGCGSPESHHGPPTDSTKIWHEYVPGWRWVRDDHPMLEIP